MTTNLYDLYETTPYSIIFKYQTYHCNIDDLPKMRWLNQWANTSFIVICLIGSLSDYDVLLLIQFVELQEVHELYEVPWKVYLSEN